jgi:uncharacterized protein with FMN-binding domain
MRRITLWALSTLTTVVLLFSYHTSTSSRSTAAASPIVARASAPQSTPAPSTTPAPSGTPTPSASSSSPSQSSGSSATKTYDGDAVMTRYGNVQVEITVAGGKITKADVLQVPWESGRDQEINSYAVPVLNSEAVQTQSSNIDMVSGATFTSQGYIQSLQSAIDQAHL